MNETVCQVPVAGCTKPLRIFRLTDQHLLLFGENESPARASYARQRERFFTDGQPQTVRLERLLDRAEKQADVLICSGDMIDFPSRENVLYWTERLKQLKIPFLCAMGNHDLQYFDGKRLPHSHPLAEEYERFCGGVLRVGEFTFVAVDDTGREIPEAVLTELRGLVKTEKHLIPVIHIPFYCDSLHEAAVDFWHRDLTIGGKGEEPNRSGEVLRQLFCESPNVVTVLCGHLHFSHTDWLRKDLPQIITPMTCVNEPHIIEWIPKG